MIVFMLTCIPLAYILVLVSSASADSRARTVRNPLITGGLAFAAYLGLAFFLGNGYPPDYQLGPAFRYFAVDALLLPFAWAVFIFTLVHGRRLLEPGPDLLLTARSFLAGFLFLLSIQDLVAGVSMLSPVELWCLPLARAVWFILVSHWLAEWRSSRWRTAVNGLVFLLVQLLLAFGLAFAWLSQPLAALGCYLLPLGLALLLLLNPEFFRGMAGGRRTA